MKKLPDVGGVDVGHGLFSDAGIAAGSFIAEYVGVLYARRGAPSAYSLFYPCHDGSYEVDAAEYGNVCRFVNHSSTRCNAAYKHVLHQVMCVCPPGRAASRRADQSPHITAPPVMLHVPVPYDKYRVLCTSCALPWRTSPPGRRSSSTTARATGTPAASSPWSFHDHDQTPRFFLPSVSSFRSILPMI